MAQLRHTAPGAKFLRLGMVPFFLRQKLHASCTVFATSTRLKPDLCEKHWSSLDERTLEHESGHWRVHGGDIFLEMMQKNMAVQSTPACCGFHKF